MRSGTDVGRLGLARSQRSNLSQRFFDGVEVRALCRPFKFFHTVRQTISVWTSLCAPGPCHAETVMGLPQTVATKLEVQNRLVSLYAVALIFPYTGTKGPSPNHEKQSQAIIPPPPNFTVGTMHWGR